MVEAHTPKSRSLAPIHRTYRNLNLIRAILAIALAYSVLACTGVTTGESHATIVGLTQPKANVPPAKLAADPAEQDLAKALARVAQGRYRLAEPVLLPIASRPSARTDVAQVALAELELMTGRGESALTRALAQCHAGAPLAIDACAVAAEAMRRRGDADAAIALLETIAYATGPRRLQLTLADTLADRGRLTEARVIYRRLVDDFAQTRISNDDARELAIAGRAAHRLGAFRDANELYIRAETTGIAELATLLWRSELYLDAHDTERARAVADEALRFAPEHPAALLLAARVRLNTGQDAEQGERFATQVLATDPHRGDAHAVLAGLALRDLDFERANRHIDRGLEREPRHLELLSLRAVTHFLADRPEDFDRAVVAVLGENPNHARVYRLVAEYAEAEHRYEETIPLLRHATQLDPEDAAVRAQLGLQLLRSGQEREGRKQMALAAKKDPFDLRARNTLALYAKKIDKEYSSLRHGQFTIRLPNKFREILAGTVSAWLDAAEQDLQRRYGRLEAQPIFVELYEDIDSFGVRTSGVPSTFLQGICFGQVIVARLPTDEPTNLGMTLWHELSHVHHLALSKNRVPRWFTEGLAEVETASYRAEWSREQDLAVYEAMRDGRLAAVKQMNHAFSHAASLDDLAVAYVASTVLVDYIQKRYGSTRIAQMLQAWGQHKSTEAVVAQVLGLDLDALDRDYRLALRERFKHFDHQYLPQRFPSSTDAAQEQFLANPQDPRACAAMVHAELQQGRLSAARQILARGLRIHATAADLLWVSSLVDAADQKPEPANLSLQQLISQGNDGYFVRMQLALLARMRGDLAAEKAELDRAQAFYPRASEPLYRLAAMAREANDKASELLLVARLASLEEADLQIHYRLVELYLELGRATDARAAADDLLFVNPLNAESYRLRARVATANGQVRLAAASQRLAQLRSKAPNAPKASKAPMASESPPRTAN